MRGPDGTFLIDGDELATLIAGQEFWWVLPDGSTTTTDVHEPPAEGALFLMSRSDPWIDQWDGDLQRACDEQLNPTMRANAHLFPEESTDDDRP